MGLDGSTTEMTTESDQELGDSSEDFPISEFLIRVFSGHRKALCSAAFSRDASYVLTASMDHTARLFDLESGECMQQFKAHRAAVHWIAANKDCSKVVTASADRTARLFDVRTGKCECVLEGHGSRLSMACFSPDCQWVATCGGDRSARLYRIPADAEWQQAAAYNATLGLDDEGVSVEAVCRLAGHTAGIYMVSFSSDGEKLLSASHDCTARLFDVATGSCEQIFSGHSAHVYSAQFSPDELQVLTASADGTCRLFDADSADCVRILGDSGARIYTATFSQDGVRVLAACADGCARLYGLSTGACERVFPASPEFATHLASFSPDCTSVLTVSDDGYVRIFDTNSAEIEHSWQQRREGKDEHVRTAAFSPDSEMLLVADHRTAKLFKVSKEEREH